MLRIKDRKQQHLLDPWFFPSPKRRAMLDQQWPGFFRSNMARLGRIGIFVRAIDRFWVNLKRHHHGVWDKVDKDLVQRYQGKTANGCFAELYKGLSRPAAFVMIFAARL